jgi:Cytochrome c3
MAQVFSPRHNLTLKLLCLGALIAVTTAALVYRLNVRRDAPPLAPIEQPIPFSHRHHVGDDGIDCRYCHTSVETAASAGIPSTAVCMNGHKQIWSDSPYLEPVRASFRTGKPIEWWRVHDLPDYVYFNHSIHVNKGVGCSTCHGRIDQMPITYQASTLQMEWCLGCHRNPEKFVREKAKVFDMEWRAENKTEKEITEGKALVAKNHIQPPKVLTSCSTCHR